MKLTQRLNELINSGITLTASERKEVEEFIQSKTKPVSKRYYKDAINKVAEKRFYDRTYRV